MKKITFLSLLLLIAFQVQAQDEIRLGLKAGANLSTLSGDDLDADFLFAYHVGGFAEIQITEKFSFVPEMIFSLQGYQNTVSLGEEFEGLSASADVDEQLDLSYLNFPLMARFNITEFFYAEAGPQIGLLMGARFDSSFSSSAELSFVDGDGNTTTITEEVVETSSLNVRDQFDNIDFGVNIGLGGNITDNIMVSLRYYLGLNEIDNQNLGFTNQVIMASLGYRF